jgi:hypothetical protein
MAGRTAVLWSARGSGVPPFPHAAMHTALNAPASAAAMIPRDTIPDYSVILTRLSTMRPSARGAALTSY